MYLYVSSSLNCTSSIKKVIYRYFQEHDTIETCKGYLCISKIQMHIKDTKVFYEFLKSLTAKVS